VLGAVGMLQGAGPIGCCLSAKVLKGVASAACYAYRAFGLSGVLLLEC
jgi:hypothetical protein